ncbi:MAG TPA: glycosyltransferase family 9 protein [Terriglobia bacterium]|nr:glycosyltransferase family 9 protein [Terriglobia bacterium]
MIKTLIVRACAIGDFVVNLPALQALHKVQPHARFTLVGYPSTLELAREFIPVDAIYSIETSPWSRLFHEPISGWYFDSAIVWMRDPVFAGNLRLSGVPDVLRCDPFPQYGHASAHLLRTIKLPVPPLPDFWEPSSAEIILHPGSGSAGKNWPYFDQLALFLREGLPEGQVRVGIPEGLTLVEVSHRLRRARAYIGNDSGITHLAAFLGVPTVALFGPTDPRTWGPIGRRSRIIWKRTLDEISVDEVLLAHGTHP